MLDAAAVAVAAARIRDDHQGDQKLVHAVLCAGRIYAFFF